MDKHIVMLVLGLEMIRLFDQPIVIIAKTSYGTPAELTSSTTS